MRTINTLKGITLATAFFLNINFLYSQVTIGSTALEPKQEEKVIIKPIAYDSLNDLTYQSEEINYYQDIGLKVYCPPHNGWRFIFPCDKGNKIKSEYIPIPDSIHGEMMPIGNTVENKYYTIIDVYYGERLDSLGKIMNMDRSCGSPLLVLRSDSSKDTLYWNNVIETGSLILVPYFVKQKQLYEGKSLICVGKNEYFPYLNSGGISTGYGDKWKCTEVTLLQNKQVEPGDPHNYNDLDLEYHIYYILKNEKNETLILPRKGYSVPISFITEEVYNKQQQEENLKQEELNAKREKEEENRIANEKREQERFRIDCGNKFGQKDGELIAQGHIEIGMTTEMCKVAWGTPWDIERTTTNEGTDEHWFYSWKYNLYFEKGV